MKNVVETDPFPGVFQMVVTVALGLFLLIFQNGSEGGTVVFWGSIIRLEISAQYHIFILLKLEKWMNSEG